MIKRFIKWVLPEREWIIHESFTIDYSKPHTDFSRIRENPLPRNLVILDWRRHGATAHALYIQKKGWFE